MMLRRFRGLFTAAAVCSFLLYILIFPDRLPLNILSRLLFPISGHEIPIVSSTQHLPQQERLTDLIQSLLTTFKEHEPVPTKLDVTFNVLTTSENQGDTLEAALDFKATDLMRMKQIHSSMVASLPEYPKKLFGGKGIVMVAGGRFLRIALLSLRMLRRTGTTLPIELWMQDESEYNAEFCDEVASSTLKVKCRLLSNYLGVDTVIGRYQLKSFAMLLSSFEQILFLDSDDFATNAINNIFDSSNFTSTGAVIWPDYWAASASPWLYHIINSPQTFFKTCETGQLLWNKKTHFGPLVLASYYNYYGPDYFYPLLSLGAAGQGDKETFLLACQVLNITYTFLPSPVMEIGYADDEFHGTAMCQADPRDPDKRVHEYLFIHAHFPKVDSLELFKEGELLDGRGRRIPRFWGDRPKQLVGWDVELAAWEEIQWIECESSLRLEDDTICRRVTDHVKWIHEE